MNLNDLMHHLAVAIVKADAALDQFRLSNEDEERYFMPQTSSGEVVLLLGLVFVWLPLRVAWYRLGQLRGRISGG